MRRVNPRRLGDMLAVPRQADSDLGHRAGVASADRRRVDLGRFVGPSSRRPSCRSPCPNRFEIPPTWLLPTSACCWPAALRLRIRTASPRIRPSFDSISIMLIGVITLANAGSAGRLITALLEGRAHEDSATSLLLTGGASG